MRGVATLHVKQFGEHKPSTLNNSRESIKNHEYFLAFKAQFEKVLYTEEEPIPEQISGKNLVILSV
jgi:hypothetical protein